MWPPTCSSTHGKRSRYMLAVCECERRQSLPQPAAAPTAEAVAGAMEGAGRRRARPRLRGAVRQRAGRRRGPNNPICLSPPRYRHPEVFCEAGIETIQTAVPASARSVRLVLRE
jgi:hypothetical protein